MVRGLRGNTCEHPDLVRPYEDLKESIAATRPIYALELADSILHIMDTKGLTQCQLYQLVRFNKGAALELIRQSEEALSLYYDIVRAAEKAGYWELAAQTYISIGRTHEDIGRPEDCLRNLKAARAIIEFHQLPEAMARFAIRYASYHRIYDNKDSATVYARRAIDYGKRYNVKRSELDGHLLLGLLANNKDSSIFHHQAAVDICLKRKDYSGAAYQELNIARRYLNGGELKKAMMHLDTGIYYGDQISEDYFREVNVHQLLFDLKRILYERQGSIDSAYQYLIKSRALERKVNYQINQQEITQKEIAFALEKEQEKLNYEKQRGVYFFWGLIALAVLLSILALALFNNERKKQFISRQKDLITIKNEKLNESLRRQSLLLSEVHHRVKNNLQLVISLLTLKSYGAPETGVQLHLDDLSNKVYSIGLIHEQLYRSGEFEKIDLEDYFGGLASYFRNLQSEETPFSIQLKTETLQLNLETVLPLGIICTELLSNSLKYARLPGQQLNIDLSVGKEQDQYLLQYRDNGPGYPSGQLKRKENSLGGLLINSMVRQLRGKSATSNHDGAIFTLHFQEKQVSSI